jgi:DNA polymerase III alpha subunit
MDIVELMDKGMDHDYSWLYNEEMGTAEHDKSLVYVFSMRTFVTSKGKQMANIYAWDGVKIIKIVIFPTVYTKVKHLIDGTGWYAIKMSKIIEKESLTRLDSYKLASDTGIIKIEDYISRKGLVKNSYA